MHLLGGKINLHNGLMNHVNELVILPWRPMELMFASMLNLVLGPISNRKHVEIADHMRAGLATLVSSLVGRW